MKVMWWYECSEEKVRMLRRKGTNAPKKRYECSEEKVRMLRRKGTNAPKKRYECSEEKVRMLRRKGTNAPKGKGTNAPKARRKGTNAPKARTAEFIIFCKLFIEKPKKPINTLLWSTKLRNFEDTSYRNLEFKNLVVGNNIFL